MKLIVRLVFVLGAVIVNDCVDGWKPIVGPPSPYRSVKRPIVVDDGALHTASSSKSVITFNGQTISTSIGDIEANDASGPVLTVDPPDLTSDLEGNSRVLGGDGEFGTSKFLTFFGDASAAPPHDPQCSVEKYAFESEGTVQYDVAIPKLEQFTLCSWMRFTNHKGDHSIFTYSVDGEPREIQFWVANAKGSSYLSLAVHGQSLFRLNYPLKLRTWHHACASWNGKTGEWQLWVKAERVGRGFHNRLVGHLLSPHGVAYSGGPSITGQIAPGHHMEVTVLQLYKVALSAGKAHRDHKHHHVHHFTHEGPVTTTQVPPSAALQQLQSTPNPFLANGPVSNRAQFNFDPLQAANVQPPLQTLLFPGQTNFMNGQFSSAQRLVQQQFTVPPPVAPTTPSPTAPLLFPSNDPAAVQPTAISSPSSFFDLNDPANVRFVDDPSPSAPLLGTPNRFLFKRNNNNNRNEGTQIKRIKIKRIINKRATNSTKVAQKRALVALSDGSFIDDKNLAGETSDSDATFFYDGLAQFGANDFQQGLTKQASIEDEIKEHDREAAEDEVKAVLTLCSACEIEPFIGAVAMAWKDAKKQPEHAILGHSIGGCGEF